MKTEIRVLELGEGQNYVTIDSFHDYQAMMLKRCEQLETQLKEARSLIIEISNDEFQLAAIPHIARKWLEENKENSDD